MAFGLSAGAISLIGTGAGLLMSGGGKGGGGGGGQQTTTTQNKDPWAPAQPYMLENMKDAKKLQDFYKANPFNEQQKTSYQNIYGDIDNYRQNIAPGLMDFANNAMTNTYKRGSGGAPGRGGNYGGPVQAGGLLQGAQPGPFNAPRGQSYGLIDFNAQNPHTAAAMPQAAPQPQAVAPGQREETEAEKQLRLYHSSPYRDGNQ